MSKFTWDLQTYSLFRTSDFRGKDDFTGKSEIFQGILQTNGKMLDFSETKELSEKQIMGTLREMVAFWRKRTT